MINHELQINIQDNYAIIHSALHCFLVLPYKNTDLEFRPQWLNSQY